MKTSQFLLIALTPMLLAAKSDPLNGVAEPDHTILTRDLQRFAKDQIAQNWTDFYEIADQDVATKRTLGIADEALPLDRDRFVDGMNNAIASGGTPVLKSLDVTEVKTTTDGYDIRACSKGARESFHYKGIIEFHAVIRKGLTHFGSWSYVVNSPHSCAQKDDSPY